MIDAAMQLPNGFKRFLHNDLAALTRAFSQHSSSHVVATEGVFSMDGDSPDMPELLALCQQHNTPLLLDDAHGLGVLGREGAGTMSSQGLANTQLQCVMANFGKALGAHGGFLAADAVTIDYLRQTSRHYIYSTALSPGYCEAIRLAIQACRTQQWRRDKLQDNIDAFRNMAVQAGIGLMPSRSAIQPLIIGESERAMVISQQLKERGIWLTAIRPPTVPKGQARLRITLSSSHSQEDLQCLVQNLCQVLAI
jgi:8-amino-7-oxononanoate synthase